LKTPKSINPDRLIDAIVEIRYYSRLPLELLIGIFFDSLDDSYNYSNRPTTRVNSNLTIGSNPLFYNDKIKILCTNGSLIFNILSNYIGWENYEKEIRNFVAQINNKKSKIEKFTRVGVRYISEYEEINIHNKFNFNFDFGMPDIKSDIYTFRSEFTKDTLKVFLNLQNNIRQKKSENNNIRISTVDVDVSNDNLNCTSLDQIMIETKKAHDLQKEVFYRLMKEDFLLTLKPSY